MTVDPGPVEIVKKRRKRKNDADFQALQNDHHECQTFQNNCHDKRALTHNTGRVSTKDKEMATSCARVCVCVCVCVCVSEKDER